jgi:Fis family transcriptional regulator, factor for inversion stimulation protein
MIKNIHTESTTATIRASVKEAWHRLIVALEGEDPIDVHQLMLEQMEGSLLVCVMKYTRQNQSKAARVLGVSRGTLRKLLKKYNLL